MPRGPKGKKRPADVIGNANHVMRIATGKVMTLSSKSTRTLSLSAAKANAKLTFQLDHSVEADH